MRKTVSRLTLLGALGVGVAVLPGCSSAWWQTVTSNPALSVQEFEATISIATNAAELAWPAILQAIPPAQQSADNLQFQNALAAVNHAEEILNDGVNAAIAAEQSNPDFTTLMQAVTDAVGQVVAIVDEYTVAPAPTDAGILDAAPPAPSLSPKVRVSVSVSSVADMHAAYNSLSRWGVKVK